MIHVTNIIYLIWTARVKNKNELHNLISFYFILLNIFDYFSVGTWT